MFSRISVLTIYVVLFTIVRIHAESDSFETVKSAPMFAIGGVGITGVTSNEELALRKIRDGLDAREQLRKLLAEGTAAGKMYSLFGLKQLDAADYDALAKPYRNSKAPVRRIQGCIISTASTADIVQWIDQYAKQLGASKKADNR